MNENLEKLRDLTVNLTLPTIIDSNNGYREYKANGGSAFSWTIHRTGDRLLVQRWFASKNCVWQEHSHKGIETIFIYEGSMDLIVDSEKYFLKAGDEITIDREIIHSASILEACKFIVITFDPIEKGYTNGR